jgi:RHS repeat-associated protein
MAMQDVETTSSGTTVTDYTLGARGVDAVSKTDSSGTSVGYPLYDGHGNRVATLTKSGSSFALGDLRSYDAWGNVASGSQTGRPRGRYVANLGHVQDDESGLVYMRARYYEPVSGRFVSEDTARDGANWFVYCVNDPVNFSDATGKSASALMQALDWLAILLTAGERTADGLGLNKQFQAFLGVLAGVTDTIALGCKVIQAAALAERRSAGLAFAAIQGVMLLQTIAVLYTVQNIRWWIELNSDSDAETPSWY